MVIGKKKHATLMAVAVITVMLISTFVACTKKPVENNIKDIMPSEMITELTADVSPEVISFAELEPLEVPEVELENVEFSDIKEILTEMTEGETDIYFYRAQNDDIYGAFTADGGDICRFIKAYDADVRSGYESGFSIGAYNNLFGFSGFIMGYDMGAAYHAYEYYYFDENKIPVILVQCNNNYVMLDLNNDGYSELASFYSISGSPCIFFERGGKVYMVDVITIVQTRFPEWRSISSDAKVHKIGATGAPWINLYYILSEDGKLRYCTVTFAPDALTVNMEMKFEPSLVTGEFEDVSSIIIDSPGKSRTLEADDAGRLFAALEDCGLRILPFPEHMEAQTSDPIYTVTILYKDGRRDTIYSTETGKGYYRLLDTYGAQGDRGYIYADSLDIYSNISQ